SLLRSHCAQHTPPNPKSTGGQYMSIGKCTVRATWATLHMASISAFVPVFQPQPLPTDSFAAAPPRRVGRILSPMLLRVGELAKRTGVTVRALHHYDSISLLRPSGRSEGGYRLYDREDVARLHGIQTLRRMGVPLAEVAQLLDGGAQSLQAILAR